MNNVMSECGGALTFRAQGEANSYVLLQGGDWFAHVLMNGEMTVPQQEAALQAFIDGWNNPRA